MPAEELRRKRIAAEQKGRVMKTYKISEFARNIGVTEKTLRHYEKFKIVEPSVDGANGYRSYNFRDAERVLASKRFSNMGFSVKETSRLLSESSIDEVMEMFRRQSAGSKAKARRLELVAERIKELEEELGWFQKSANKGFVHTGKEWWFIQHVKDSEFVKDTETIHIVREMMDALPCSVKLMQIPREPERIEENVWGLAIEPRYAESMGIRFRPPMVKIPAGPCYHYPAAILTKKERIRKGGEDVPPILKMIKREMEEKGLSASSLGYVIGSIDSFAGDRREKHFLFCIPISG